jgi:hypothetical protein
MRLCAAVKKCGIIAKLTAISVKNLKRRWRMVVCDLCPFAVDGYDVGTRNCGLDDDYPRRNLIYENHKFQMTTGFCKLSVVVLKNGIVFTPEVVDA